MVVNASFRACVIGKAASRAITHRRAGSRKWHLMPRCAGLLIAAVFVVFAAFKGNAASAIGGEGGACRSDRCGSSR